MIPLGRKKERKKMEGKRGVAASPPPKKKFVLFVGANSFSLDKKVPYSSNNIVFDRNERGGKKKQF